MNFLLFLVFFAAPTDSSDLLTESFVQDALHQGLDQIPATRLELLQVETDLARQRLKKSLQDPISFTEEEILAKYESIKDTYTRKKRRRIYHLFKRYPSDADEAARAEVRAEIERLHAEALQGVDFEALAREHSDSQTRLRSGLLGNVQEGHYTSALDAVLRRLGEGDFSPIVEVDDGLTFFYCVQVMPAVVKPREEMIEISENLLLNQARKQVWFDFERAIFRIAQSATASPWSPIPASPRMRNFLIGRLYRQEAAERGLIDQAALKERDQRRREILAAKAIAAEVERRLIRPTEEEILAEYERRPDDFKRPAHFLIAYLKLPLDADDPRASYRDGALLIERLKSGEHDFLATAEKSDWLSEHVLSARYGIEATRALRDLAAGKRTDLVESEGALWIFELLDKESPRRMTFEEARHRAENLIGNRRVQRLKQEIATERLNSLESSP